MLFYSDNFRCIAKRLRINQQIIAPQVRLVDQDENQIGVVTLEEAFRIADEKKMDLVEVSPQVKPPVCKLLDYGKYLYKQKKIEQKQRKMQKQTEVKGIRLSLRTGEHDLLVKEKSARKFLEFRNVVKVQLIFKGREALHKELAEEKMKKFYDSLAEVCRLESPPKRQGNTLIMILAPLK